MLVLIPWPPQPLARPCSGGCREDGAKCKGAGGVELGSWVTSTYGMQAAQRSLALARAPVQGGLDAAVGTLALWASTTQCPTSCSLCRLASAQQHGARGCGSSSSSTSCFIRGRCAGCSQHCVGGTPCSPCLQKLHVSMPCLHSVAYTHWASKMRTSVATRARLHVQRGEEGKRRVAH